ncbi:tyrosine-protein phosphatase [Streptosporangium sandarakinum]|uniref:tyrosine-protein phosphatase n=1 Tax=Streptosporangium sandarakinum TaxID=1260955 RepID=UPI003D903AA6
MTAADLITPPGSRLGRRRFLTVAGTGLAGALLLPSAPARAAATGTEDPRTHFFDVEGSFNIRDIGWYSNRLGRRVKRGVVWRGAGLGRVTDLGLTQLATLGLTWDINMLSNRELAAGRPDRLPEGVQLFSAPVGDDSANPMPPTIDTTRPDAYVLQEFREYVTSPQSQASFGAAIRKIAGNGGRPVYIHCNSGTYRTGWTVALLMSLLGVDRAQIDTEFLLSNLTFGVNYAWPEYLDAGIDQARTTFGSLAGYLARGLGVDAATVHNLRRTLLA